MGTTNKKRKGPMTTEDLYRKHRALPFHIASKLAARSGVSLAPLLEVAQDAYVDMICFKWDQYDPTKSKEVTWIYSNIRWRVQDYIRKAARNPTLVPLDVARARPASPSAWGRLRTLLANLGDEASEVVHLILSAPKEIAECFGQPEGVQDVLWTYLRDRCGWTDGQIASAFNEVEASI